MTANKALLAHHGAALARLAEEQGVGSTSKPRSPVAFPSSRPCGKGWPATASRRIYGILNGTCNYILTKMR